MTRPLQTTHFGLLALLGVRSWSAYDLVGQMNRSLAAVWPRARSNLYADLKRLAAEGLADTTVESVGRRSRTRYRITRRGRTALRAWLQEPGAPPAFECEALVKLGFAPFTTKEAALAQIDVILAHAEARMALGADLAQEYVDDTGPLPERLHINAVMWRYLSDVDRATYEWATWARREIESWPDTKDSPALRERGRQILGAALDR